MWELALSGVAGIPAIPDVEQICPRSAPTSWYQEDPPVNNLFDAWQKGHTDEADFAQSVAGHGSSRCSNLGICSGQEHG